MFSDASKALCDALVEALGRNISDLKRAETTRCCRLHQEGKAGFAYVYYQKTSGAITVWCLGEVAELCKAAKNSGLEIRPRKRTPHNFGSFKCRFKIASKADVKAASRVLSTVSYQQTINSKGVRRKPKEALPEEVTEPEKYPEGAVVTISVNKYERNLKARAKCIQIHGVSCCACEFNFEQEYGEIGSGLIHVHHLKPLSSISKNYNVDPEDDPMPVCPNCHAIIHRQDPPLTIEEVKKLLMDKSLAPKASIRRTSRRSVT